MKTYDERTADVRSKITIKKRNRRIVTGTCLSLAVVILALVLFVPYSTTPPDVSMHRDSEYYDLICKLNEVTYVKPRYANNFEALLGGMRHFGMSGSAPEAMPDDMNSAGEYVEVTDNQVAGVTEADIFKRSDKYLYYLSGSYLSIYSISGEESELIGGHEVCEFDFPEDYKQTGWGWSANNAQMYLSQDCTTVTVIMDYYDEELGSCVLAVNLDVADPANVKTESYVFLPGDIISTRMVDGQLLLTYNYRVPTDSMDFDRPETFVPTYGVPGDMKPLAADSIVCPETAETARYTVVCSLDSKTLAVNGTTALLGYSQELYVSTDTIFATHAYADQTDQDAEGRNTKTDRTEITGISYADDSLAILGSVQLNGSVKDQYSMDAYDGILRVVTTTRSLVRREVWSDWDTVRYYTESSSVNADLYCVDLSDWSVVASVIGFAPEGEEATSVRFDGENAYVCTAEIVTLTDPVYFFDLSDISNITWTDTGTIDGYSTSLINLGEGYLLGIGYGDLRQLKIEVYEQTADGVESACVWEENAEFSEVYKSYFIDRERNLIGLGIWEYSGGCQYVLLCFDGYALEEVIRVPLGNHTQLENIRATIIDEHLYILSPNSGLKVTAVS